MSARWSLDQAAINKGWGCFRKKRGGAMLAVHPEFYFGGPYGTVPTRNPSRGGKEILKLKKSRRLDLSEPHNLALALQGYGGIDSIVTDLFSNLGSSGTEIVKQLAGKLNTSVENLAKDPDRLVNLLKKFAPKIGTTIKKWWEKIHKPKENTPTQLDMRQYMLWLKQHDPDAYKQKYEQIQKMRSKTNQKKLWEEQQIQNAMKFY